MFINFQIWNCNWQSALKAKDAGQNNHYPKEQPKVRNYYKTFFWYCDKKKENDTMV